MTITIEIPDNVAASFAVPGRELAREVLEAFALEGYRSERLTAAEVRWLLGFETRMEVDEFLKRHDANMHYTLDDLKNDVEVALEGARHSHDESQRESLTKQLA
jgi:hypothetical protein